MHLFDTHAHLDDEKFHDDLPAVLERAAAAGLERIVTVGITAASSAACVKLAADHDLLVATVGIQPNHVAEAAPDDWDKIVTLAGESHVVGLGETGLDRYWDFTPFAQQEDYFARHLDLSRKTGLPVVIHCREADADVARMLRDDFNKHGPVRGVMHSFCGDAEMAKTCLEMGLYISFAGMVTYKKSTALREVAKTIPLDRLVIETDSPYLAPVPKRGKRNEPAFVVHTAECLAKERDLEVKRFGEETTRNARRLFGLD